MRLDDLDEAVRLRNYRARAIELLPAAQSGHINLHLGYGGEKIDVFSIIGADPVREAIAEAARELIADYEAKLTALGVTVAP